MQHAQAWNVIERIFGVLKHCFHILLLGPEYHYSIQAQIPTALCVIHNFIHIHNSSEEDSEISRTESEEQYNQQADASDDIVCSIGFEESTNNTVTERCDRIATFLWANYQEILQSRENEYDTDFFSNTDDGEYNDE